MGDSIAAVETLTIISAPCYINATNPWFRARMGNFYTNYTLRGTTQREVAKALSGRSAIVTAERHGCVVVFEQDSDSQDMAVITELAGLLSGTLRCAVLAVLNHDDDILWYQHRDGELKDEYNSSPGYFDPKAKHSLPKGGNARELCDAFETSAVAQVESILRKSSSKGGYVFAVERHGELADALGIPSFGVGLGYNYVSGGELPEGLSEGDLLVV